MIFSGAGTLDERDLEEVQAHGSLDSDSAGAWPKVTMLFVRNDLSIKHAAPQEDVTDANWAGLSQPLATAVSCANPRTEDTIGPQSVTPPHQGDMHDPLPHTHARHAVSGLDSHRLSCYDF